MNWWRRLLSLRNSIIVWFRPNLHWRWRWSLFDTKWWGLFLFNRTLSLWQLTRYFLIKTKLPALDVFKGLNLVLHHMLQNWINHLFHIETGGHKYLHVIRKLSELVLDDNILGICLLELMAEILLKHFDLFIIELAFLSNDLLEFFVQVF